MRSTTKPPGNNQQRGVRFADDYAIDRWTADALRQLAHAPGSAEGRSSVQRSA